MEELETLIKKRKVWKQSPPGNPDTVTILSVPLDHKTQYLFLIDG